MKPGRGSNERVDDRSTADIIFWRPVPASAVNYGAAKRYCVNLSQRSVTLVIVTKSVISHRVSYNVIQCHTGTDLPGPCLGHNNNLGTMLGADMWAMQCVHTDNFLKGGYTIIKENTSQYSNGWRHLV